MKLETSPPDPIAKQPAEARPSAVAITLGRLLPLALYTAAIIHFGTARGVTFPGDEMVGSDKVLHALAFGGLAVLSYRAVVFLGQGSWARRWAWLLSVGFASLVGAILELIQSTLPYRSMEFADLVADVLGALVAVAIASKLRVERPLFGLAR